MYSASHWIRSEGVDHSRLFSGGGAADTVKIHHFLLGLTLKPCMTLPVMPRSSFVTGYHLYICWREFFTPGQHFYYACISVASSFPHFLCPCSDSIAPCIHVHPSVLSP